MFFLQPIGLVILICGVFIYNDIIIMPAVRLAEGVWKTSNDLSRKYILKKAPEPVTEKDLEMEKSSD